MNIDTLLVVAKEIGYATAEKMYRAQLVEKQKEVDELRARVAEFEADIRLTHSFYQAAEQFEFKVAEKAGISWETSDTFENMADMVVELRARIAELEGGYEAMLRDAVRQRNEAYDKRGYHTAVYWCNRGEGVELVGDALTDAISDIIGQEKYHEIWTDGFDKPVKSRDPQGEVASEVDKND